MNHYPLEPTFEPAVKAELLIHLDSSTHLFLKTGGARKFRHVLFTHSIKMLSLYHMYHNHVISNKVESL